jgi:dTDP-4-dehydrorhamnose reductase
LPDCKQKNQKAPIQKWGFLFKPMQQKRKILVIGGSGFLGAKFLELAPKNFDVHSTYLTKKTNIRNINEYKIDLLDNSAILKLIDEVDPQIIFHTAKVKFFDENPEENKKSIEALARVSKRKGIKLFFVSTDAVFDGEKGNYVEKDELNPLGAYGISKKLAEEVIRNATDDFAIIRTSYIYGKNIFGYDKRTRELLNELKLGKNVFRFDDLFRSITLVNDLAEACWKLIETDFKGMIHIAGEKESMFDFSKNIAQAFDLDESFIFPNSYKETGKIFTPDTSLNINMARRLIKFNPNKIGRSSFV